MDKRFFYLVRRGVGVVGALVAALAMLGCDSNGNPIEEFGLEKLKKGVSTEAEVRTVMGAPDTVWDDGEGAHTLEYPKGPEGIRTWMFAINALGTMIDYRQVLTEDNFSRVVPHLSSTEVRRMLGRPRSVMQFRLKNEEVWDWKYRHLHEERLFNVHFDIDSMQVVRTSVSDIGGH
ncbi:hypothetical protein [Herbaspirillum sp. YR522]|uniref:hypothetical protein n=1 Tax=Herbaspirillum sp. YR522 TaxID=1144342 RepID=UPI00026F53E8|nr:hypothetical protein [Herbaspirillum sp. YR522]EJM99192.1 hypothetical protein PMI40_03752 [Herbaspirillum sp. YR522]